MLGLPCSTRTTRDDLAPVSTPAVLMSVRSHTERRVARLRAVLAGACQRLWLLTIDDACNSSPELGVSSSLALRPP